MGASAGAKTIKAKKIIGILLVKQCVLLDPADAMPVRKIPLNKVPIVPHNEPLLGILDKFQEGRSHMAIVSRFSAERAQSVKKAVKPGLTAVGGAEGEWGAGASVAGGWRVGRCRAGRGKGPQRNCEIRQSLTVYRGQSLTVYRVRCAVSYLSSSASFSTEHSASFPIEHRRPIPTSTVR